MGEISQNLMPVPRNGDHGEHDLPESGLYRRLIPKIIDRNPLDRIDFGFRRGENRSRTRRSGEDFRRRPEAEIDRPCGWQGNRPPEGVEILVRCKQHRPPVFSYPVTVSLPSNGFLSMIFGISLGELGKIRGAGWAGLALSLLRLLPGIGEQGLAQGGTVC